MTPDQERDDASQISTDSETIRAWADAHDATPYRHTDRDEVHLLPERKADEDYEVLEWEEFGGHLEDGNRVVIYHGEATEDPFEVTDREDAMTRSNVSREELEDRLVEGETVTSTVTETTVVEEVIVEEATIESELIDTEMTDDRVVEAELIARECSDCTLVDTGAVADADWFDEDRYMADVGGPSTVETGAGAVETETVRTETEAGTADAAVETGTVESDAETGIETDPEPGETRVETDAEGIDTAVEPGAASGDTEPVDTETVGAVETEMVEVESPYPFDVELDVAETWSVTREFTERFTVESRVEDVDVAETESVEDRDVDVEGLQRSIAESDLLSIDLSPDEVMSECDVETEFGGDERIETHFTRSSVVEDEVVDRRRVRAEVTAADLRAIERVDTSDVATETTGDETPSAAAVEVESEGPVDTDGSIDDDVATGAGEEPAVEARGVDEDDGAADEAIPLSGEEVGKDVVDASGEKIGMVTDVSDDGTTMYVDADPSMTERIKAAMDWGSADEDDYPVELAQIDEVTRDAIQLKGAEELDELTPPEA